MKRNILFLDIDGVLNTGATDRECLEFFNRLRITPDGAIKAQGLLNPTNIVALNKLVERFQPEIVFSTSWADVLEPQELMTVLEQNGCVGFEICKEIPVTVRKQETRAGQIEDTLAQLVGLFDFVILDDRESGASLKEHAALGPKVVWCDLDVYGDYVARGLQVEHLDLVSEHLEF